MEGLRHEEEGVGYKVEGGRHGEEGGRYKVEDGRQEVYLTEIA